MPHATHVPTLRLEQHDLLFNDGVTSCLAARRVFRREHRRPLIPVNGPRRRRSVGAAGLHHFAVRADDRVAVRAEDLIIQRVLWKFDTLALRTLSGNDQRRSHEAKQRDAQLASVLIVTNLRLLPARVKPGSKNSGGTPNCPAAPPPDRL